MSEIEKLSIRGIRSFSPDTESIIAFFTPLTLIVGHNGAGKTTVIECLKYACIGDLPPNSSKSFVHDPRVANVSEVKGQVKLQFRNVNGKELTATRSLSFIQKKTTSTMKTLESVLSAGHGENKIMTDGVFLQVSITSKCAELDATIPDQLGVSRPILDNVIFCHQEESFWPLSEPGVLKKKFDDIFASTRYTKALDSIKTLRKDSTVQIRIGQGELNHLKENKERADILQKELDVLSDRIAVSTERKNELADTEIKSISEKLKLLERERNELHGIHMEINAREIKRNFLMGSLEELKADIEIFEETDEELASMLKQYETSVEMQQNELIELNEIVEQYCRSISRIESDLSKELTAKGQLQAEIDAYSRSVVEADENFVNIAEKLNIRGFSAPFDENRLEKFVAKLNDGMDNQQKSLEKAKAESLTRLSNVSSRLHKAQGGIASQQETKKMLKDRMESNRRKIVEFTTNVQKLKVTLSELAELKAKIAQEEEYVSIQAYIPVEFESKLQQLNLEVHAKERTLTTLGDEIAALNSQSESRARLGLKTQDLRRKEEGFNAMNKEKVLARSKTEIETNTRELSAIEAKLFMSKSRLQKLSKDVDEKSRAINEACGGADFLHAYEAADEDYNEELSNEKTLSAAHVMINKYMRLFGRDNKEAYAVSLAEKHLKLKRLAALKPNLHELESIRDTEIPSVKTSIKTFEQEREVLNSVLEDLEGDYAIASVDVQSYVDLRVQCEDVLRAEAELFRLKSEVEGLERDLTATGGGGGNNGRIPSTVQAEINEVNSKLADLRQEINRLNTERFTKQNNLAIHEKLLQTAKQELQSKMHLWDQREALQSSITDLRNEMEKFSRDIEVADSVIIELTPNIRAIEQELAAEQENSSITESNFNKTIQQYRNYLSSVNTFIAERNRFKSTDTQSKLEKCAATIKKLRNEIQKIQVQRDESNARILTIQKTASEVTGIQRAVSDNLKFREQEKLLQEILAEIDKLKEDTKRFNHMNAEKQRHKYVTKIENLSGELAMITGELKIMEEQQQRIKDDLESNFADIVQKHQRQVIKLKTESLAVQDLEKYSKALENAIMKYHTMKMDEINKIIRELWVNTYKGNDIETIEIRSDNENSTAKNRSYNYRVVMIKEQTELDMRGRCSAGQKVLACLIIRLALAETFCLNCGILALDEPTTNLDRDNSEALAESLSK
ncbi:DNA repair protein rad50 [Physocladia obscura]|uniref:DNA repair protein RAD50 n=1 Tax=Physocladia obscura TaxID=109957 RepID=A0AAD5T0R1_9FUNG|nr:DNA repair protein rad50 [Physocladia obscura]